LGSAAVTAWLGRHVALRVQGAWAPTRFELRSSETYTTLGESAEDEAPPLSRLHVWMYDLDMLFRLPLSLGRVEPYAVAGVGAIEYRLQTAEDEVVPEPARMAFDGGRQRRFAGVLGLGAVIPLERHGLLLNFELSSHITRTPLSEDAAPGVVQAPEAGSRVVVVGYTRGVRLMLGLTIPLFTPGHWALRLAVHARFEACPRACTRLTFAHTSPTVRLLDLHQPPTESAATAIALDRDLDDLQPGPRARQRQVGGEHERPTYVDDFP